jgi:hypothetical protein
VTGTPPPAVRLTFPVTAEDQRAAVRAIVLRTPSVRWMRILVLALPPVMIAWSMASGWPLGLAIFRNVFWIVFAALYLLAGIPMMVRAGVRAVRKAYPEWAEEQTVTLDQSGIRLASPSGTTDVAWDDVQAAAEARDAFLVQFGPGRVFFIPRHVASSQGMIDPLRQVLRERLGARARLRTSAAPAASGPTAPA